MRNVFKTLVPVLAMSFAAAFAGCQCSATAGTQPPQTPAPPATVAPAATTPAPISATNPPPPAPLPPSLRAQLAGAHPDAGH